MFHQTIKVFFISSTKLRYACFEYNFVKRKKCFQYNSSLEKKNSNINYVLWHTANLIFLMGQYIVLIVVLYETLFDH